MSDASFEMTQELALEVKRIKLSGTFRTVADEFSKAHPDLPILPGHQTEGIELCKEAGKVLGEDCWSWANEK